MRSVVPCDVHLHMVNAMNIQFVGITAHQQQRPWFQQNLARKKSYKTQQNDMRPFYDSSVPRTLRFYHQFSEKIVHTILPSAEFLAASRRGGCKGYAWNCGVSSIQSWHQIQAHLLLHEAEIHQGRPFQSQNGNFRFESGPITWNPSWGFQLRDSDRKSGKKTNKTTCCQGCCEHQCPDQEGSCWWGIDWVHLQWPSFKIHCDHGLVQEFQKNPGAHSLPLANTITKTFPFTAIWPAIPSASTNPWPISSIASGRSSQIAPSGWGTPEASATLVEDLVLKTICRVSNLLDILALMALAHKQFPPPAS